MSMADKQERPGGIASGMRAVARAAAESDDLAELLRTALDTLRATLPFGGAAFLEYDGDVLRPGAASGSLPEEDTELDLHPLPGLRAILDGSRAARLDPDRDAAIVSGLRTLVDMGPDTEERLLVPVRKSAEPSGVIVLTRGSIGTIDERAITIATIYGSLLELGVAAVVRARRLEHLREVLQERNALLVEEASGDTDACRALEASVSRPMRRIVHQARQVARTDAPVLISGETGTGKEVLARAIHEWSDRADGPFVQLNCAALSDHLIESELFGHVKGAFSGAVSDRPGRFRVADGGTLLLDEIGEMPLEAQTKLLRVLEGGAVVPVGSDRPVSVDVRVIAATNVELEIAIDRGRFREDLYFRLHVFPLHLPPLRERVDDIPQLVEQILARISRRTGHGPWRIADREMAQMARYPWPGNVRELVNAIERARVYSPLGGTLELALDERRTGRRGRAGRHRWPTLDEHRREYIEEVLRHTSGKIYGPGGAAELLDIPPSTLQSRMTRLGVERPTR